MNQWYVHISWHKVQFFSLLQCLLWQYCNHISDSRWMSYEVSKKNELSLAQTILQKYRHTRNLLETRMITSLLMLPNFHGKEAKKILLCKTNFLNGRLKTTEFFNHYQKLSNFRQNFMGLAGLIDAKGINFTQSIWPSGCPT